jgi:hypothetical protein
MKPKSAKAKGRRFQWDVAEKIGELLDLPVGYDEVIAPREMGQQGVDVKLVGEAAAKFKYDVECKNTEAWQVPAWITQARKNQKEGRQWLVCASKNRYKPVVILDMEHFFDLLKRLNDTEPNCG